MKLSRKSTEIPSLILGLALLVFGEKSWGLDEHGSSKRLWPLPLRPSLSSCFGEYRDGHLHAGIDIRTNGKEGIPCRAVDDGYISRIRASSHGYGKTLYVHLHDGETAVYAHLSEFSPLLESFLYGEQRRLGTYEIDVTPPPGRFSVQKGEVIGYTGITGGVAPHLHFEIRDAGENPMNPMTHGWTLPDDVFPSIEQILWIPIDVEARIDGLAFPKEVPVKRVKRGVFSVQDTVVIRGGVVISLRVFDRLNAISGRLSPYRIELYVDGRSVAQIEMERFSFPQAREVNLIYDMERVLSRGEYYMNLFKRQGETLWNRQFHNGGIVHASRDHKGSNPSRSIHLAEIRVSDLQGNTSVLTAPFCSTMGDSGIGPLDVTVVANERKGELPGFFMFDDFLSIRTDVLSREAEMRLMSITGRLKREAGPYRGRPGNRNRSGVESQVDVKQFVATCADFDISQGILHLESALDGPTVYLVPVRGAQSRRLGIPDLGVSLRMPVRSLRGDGFMFFSQWDPGTGIKPRQEELELRSKVVRLGPLSLAIRTSVEVGIRLNAPVDGREAVYYLDEKKDKWVFIQSNVDQSITGGSAVNAQVRRPGVYAAFVDQTAPWIGEPTLRKHRMYADGRLYPEIVVDINDWGSGVDSEKTGILIDGEKQIAQWNGYVKKMFVLLREQNIIGHRELTVVAVDRAGNESHLKTNLSISENYFAGPGRKNGEHVE